MKKKCAAGLKKSKAPSSNKRACPREIRPLLMRMYRRLRSSFGYRNWWPGEAPFEIIIGAILTQNTSWTNVEKAIANLKKQNLLRPAALKKLPAPRLAELIRPCGYFNIKAGRLRSFISWLYDNFGGSLDGMFRTPAGELRGMLLSVRGIGPETADSILLYAGGIGSFVVDTYTRRIFSRHGFICGNESYDEIKDLFESALKKDVGLFNDYHAQIVECGKTYCRKKPLCRTCPLNLSALFL